MIPEDVKKLADEVASSVFTNAVDDDCTLDAPAAANIIARAILTDREARSVIPAGYKLVPVEPTQDMVDAAEATTTLAHNFCEADLIDIYKAMVFEASPSPSREETEGEDEYSRGVRDVVTFLHGQAAKEVSKSGKTSLNSIANLIGNTFKTSPKPDTSALLLSVEQPTPQQHVKDLLDAAREVIACASDTYKKRNGHLASFEDDSGEKCWIVPFDAFEGLRSAVEALVTEGKAE